VYLRVDVIRYDFNVSIGILILVGHVIKFHKGLYEEFGHVPTGIYIQIDTLK
jgi:hypothetical protein